MPLVFRYSDPGGAEEPAVMTDLGNTVTGVRLGTLAISQSAEIGDAAISGIEIDDPEGTLDLVGYRTFRVEETSAPSNSRWIANAIIGDQRISRGGSDRPSLRLDAARVWSIDLVDRNWSLGVQIITGTDGNRPAETAGERLRWVLNAYTHVRDFGNVTYPSNHLDACDYRHQTAKDVIADCALPGGYNYWADWMEAQDHVELFFMLPSSSLYTSAISISNVYADVDSSTVFAPAIEAELVRSPSRVTYGVDLQYDGGSVYLTDSTTGNQFAFVDRSAPLANVKSSAKATTIATRFLADNDEQDERVTCSIKVPAAQVNDLRHGHRTQARFSHLPGWESFRDCRVLRRTVAQEAAGGEAWYRIDLELTPLANAASCSTALAAATTDTAGGLESAGNTASVTSTITEDGYVVALLLGYNGNTPNAENMNDPAGYTVLDNEADFSRSTWSLSYKAVTAGSQTATATFTRGFNNVGCWIAAQAFLPWAGVTVVQEKMSPANASAVTFDNPVTAGNTVIMLAVTGGMGSIAFSSAGGAPTTNWTELWDEIGISNNIHTAAWARCVESGDGQHYAYSVSNSNLQQNGCYIVEIAT